MRIDRAIAAGVLSAILAGASPGHGHEQKRSAEPAPATLPLPGTNLFLNSHDAQTQAAPFAARGERRSRLIRIDRSYLNAQLATMQPIRMGFFGDADILFLPQAIEAGAEGVRVITGTTVNAATASLTLTLSSSSLIIDATIDGRYYHVSPAARGVAALYKITEFDPSAFPHGPNATPPTQKPPSGDLQEQSLRQGAPVAPEAASGPYSVKLLVVYTKEAAAQSTAGIQTDIQAVVASVNRIWSNSGVNGQLKLMAAIQLGNDYPDAQDMGTQLSNALSGGGTPAQSAIFHLRNANYADLVAIVSNGATTCSKGEASGCGYVGTGAGTGYSIVGYSYLPTGVVLSHEIGHNMGLNHDRVQDKITDQSVYNVGYVSLAGKAQDVMAYFTQCDAANITCTVNPSYSSPNITVNGYPLGIAAGGKDPADGARAVNDNIATVASYRTVGTLVDDASVANLGIPLSGAVSASATHVPTALPANGCSASTVASNVAGQLWWTYTPSADGTLSIKTVNGGSTLIFVGDPQAGAVGFMDGAPVTTPQETWVAVKANTKVFIASCVDTTAQASVSASVGFAVPQTGWWWAPSKPGMGFSLETRLGNYFIADYVYSAASGAPYWAVASGTMTDPATISGTLQTYKNGTPFGTPQGSVQQSGSDGAFTLSFTSPTTGNLTGPDGAVTPVQKYVFDSSTANYFNAAAPTYPLEGGWYWDSTTPGRGFFMERQGASIFLAAFHYTPAGAPVWHVATLTQDPSAQTFSGAMLQYANGPNLAGPAKSASQSQNLGTLQLMPGYYNSNYPAPALPGPGICVATASGGYRCQGGNQIYGLLNLPAMLANGNSPYEGYVRYRF